MRSVLAKIRLATGNVGWYDPLTNIHLTIQRPEALVYEGQNTSNLKQGVMYKTITVVDGSLTEPSNTVTPTKIKTIVEKPMVKQEEVAPLITDKKLEEVKIEDATPEEIAPVEEKPKKKTTRKKKVEKTEE